MANEQGTQTKARTGDPLLGFQFEVYFGNSTKIGFSRVSNISLGKTIHAVSDVGNHRRRYYYRDRDEESRMGHNVLVLERGVSTDESDKLLRKYVAGVNIESMTIKILQNGKAVRMLAVNNAVVIKSGFSDLDASQTSVMMRRIEIRHSGIEEQDV